MKGIKKELALVASGVLPGAALATPAATATPTAQLSSQKFVVDGKPAQIEAYAINGSTTRAQLAMILWNMEGKPSYSDGIFIATNDRVKGFVVCDDRRAWINDVVMG